MANLYEILGVKQTASQKTISDAHADQHAKFQALFDKGVDTASTDLLAIQAAFEILSDPVKREKYDDKIAASLYRQDPAEKVRTSSAEPTARPAEKQQGKKRRETVISGAAIIWVALVLFAYVFLANYFGGESKDSFGMYFMIAWAIVGGAAFQYRLGGFVAVGGGFIAALLLGGLAAKSQAPYVPDAIRAQVDCQSFVSKQLKAPSTADFAPHGETKISGSGMGPWTVIGYVDAQNSFGAKIRSGYLCTVHYEGNRAILESVTVN